jgi:WhiB family redox-sensing transcriptional regulator
MNTTTIPTTGTTDLGRDWRRHAACASGSVDPEIFYPLDLDPTGPSVTAARRVCAGCPVQLACLLDVMAGEDPARRWGITAGLTADERTHLYVTRRAVAAGPARPGAVAA